MPSCTALRLRVLAGGQWLLVLPATVYLAAATLRFMGPRQYQPARISWAIFEWADPHMTNVSASVLLIAMPVLAAILGCAMLLRFWRNDQALRQDVMATWAILRRRLILAISILATLLAGAILMAVAVHVVTD